MMKNNKGFSLMELLAAIFIGGMVTAALVLIWKTSSTQTVQGQRQTIVRNQLSNFQRQFYRDFYGADIITYPTSNDTPQALILAGLKKAKKISSTQFEVLQNASPAVCFAYCFGTGNTTTTLKRYEKNFDYVANNNKYNLSDCGSNILTNCQSNGKDILKDFTLGTIGITADGTYTLQGYIQKTFTNAANSTPIYIEVDEELFARGGN